jgi:asparagine synthase (glutamine-hydrolysing)
MCGIVGFYTNSMLKSNHIITMMSKKMFHRGPDDSGSWYDLTTRIAFGHQRLSILDLSKAGHQPMHSSSGQFVITYNGEIYNHLEIRKELNRINFNIKWQSNSDTETLLESLECWGIEVALKKLDGMFAFGVWDKKNHCLTLARDRIGEKPLYYGWQGKGENKTFLFGSELKALKAHPDFNGEINRNSIALQLRYNCIPDPYSIYKDIYKLLPGHYLQLSENYLKKNLLSDPKPYWSLSEIAVNGRENQLKIGEAEIKKELEQHLQSSIKKQMISDVPLGVFLSGGIDSSTVVALMQSQSSLPVNTFTIGFSENGYNEAVYANKIAQHLGTNHTELYVSSKTAMDVIPKLSDIYDEPFSDSSQIPTFLVSQLAKQHVKVALSGDGGDELFCGYNRYTISKKFWNILQLTPLALRKILASGIQSISTQNWNKISKFLPGLGQYTNFGDKIHKGANVLDTKTKFELYHKLCSHWHNPTEAVINSEILDTLFNKFYFEIKRLNGQEQMMALDLATYLPNDILVKLDRAAMSSSLETRVPLLDHKLIEYVWKIPHSLKFRNGQGKWILRQILNQYIPKNLTERPKMGFGVPLDAWLRGPLRDWAENLLNEKRLIQEGYFNPKPIRDKWAEHLSEKRNWQYDLWNVLMFQAWIDTNSK